MRRLRVLLVIIVTAGAGFVAVVLRHHVHGAWDWVQTLPRRQQTQTLRLRNVSPSSSSSTTSMDVFPEIVSVSASHLSLSALLDGDPSGAGRATKPHGGTVPDNRATNTDDSYSALVQMYLARYREMKVVAENLPSTDCPPLPNNNNTACWMPLQRCNASFLPVEERLGRVFQTQHPITKQQRMLIDSLANHPEPVDLVFITAASANHYEESQGLIRDLHKLVFPELRRQGEYTFHLYYYDLGLNPRQLKQLKTHCNCTVIPFPFSRLPHQFHRLSTCIWKPLILKAHLATSRITLWMDASVRFRTANLSSLLQQTQRRGVLVAHTSFMLPKHVHPAMLSYFRIQQPCQLASFYETAGGFVALSNDQLVHQGILDPWVACAFSPRCLCPSEGLRDCESYLPCKPRKGETYFQCHRFDQSALGILLALLFDWRVSDLSYWLQKDGTPWFAFRRGRRVKYFP